LAEDETVIGEANSAGFFIRGDEAFTGGRALSVGPGDSISFFLSSSGFFRLRNDNYLVLPPSARFAYVSSFARFLDSRSSDWTEFILNLPWAGPASSISGKDAEYIWGIGPEKVAGPGLY